MWPHFRVIPHIDVKGPLSEVLFGCSVVWGNGAKTLSDKLQRLQNHAVCILILIMMLMPTSHLQNYRVGWDNLETRRQKLKAELVYKFLNGLAPNYLSSKFILKSDMITFYNFRNSKACYFLATY